jgi:hypothetical protein
MALSRTEEIENAAHADKGKGGETDGDFRWN